jgi:DNA repair exonuclease SbcCD ATPase subunit
MKLELYDFKCYNTKRVFDISDQGVTLISGKSGRGKTTILSAIHFALYGAGNGTKNISDGASSCKVILRYLGMIIMRSCRPNHLTLQYDSAPEIKYEDDDAQAKISTHFGHYFDYVSYIPQQAHKVFLAQTPAEKLEILEKMLFDPELISQAPANMKKKCSVQVKSLTSELDKLYGSTSLLKEQLSEYTEPISASEECAPSTRDDSRRLLFLSNKQSLYNSYFRKRGLLQEVLDRARAEHGTVVTQLQDLSGKEFPGEAALEKHILALSQLEGIRWQEYTEHAPEECEEMIEEYNEDIRSRKKWDELKARLEQLSAAWSESEYEKVRQEYAETLKLAEALFTCPSCSKSLALVNGELELCAESAKHIEISLKKKKIAALKSTLDKLDKTRAEFTALQAQLDASVPEESLDHLRSQLLKWKKYRDCASIVLQFRPLLIKETLSAADAQSLLKGLRDTVVLTNKERALSIQISNAEEELSALESEASLCQLQDVQKEIDQLRLKLTDSKLREKLSEERARRLSQKELFEIQQTSIARLEKRRSAYQTLKGLISKAEMQYIQRTINVLEVLVNQFAEALFPDDALFVRFKLYVENKPLINIEILYKGMNCTYGMLSGGEQARLNICFTLAFSQHFGGKLLLLDECTAQLNQEAADLIFDLLKDQTRCKALVVAHQVVQGTFDEVIDLDFLDNQVIS